ncbi:MAG: cation:proton antiporter [Vulcanimicrobiota bacterium]
MWALEYSYLLIGAILMLAAVSRPLVGRYPISPAMLYLGVGWILSHRRIGFLSVDPVEHADVLEHVSELAVVISLFVCGLKCQVRASNPLWALPLRLAFLSMTFTVGMITLIGFYLLNLPLGVALILGAVLAPTDPVLASEVQIEGIHDRDKVRFALTGEGGFNDGTAFPFLYLGLGFLGLHHLGEWWGSWWAVDVLWGILGGLALGAICGAAAGLMVLKLPGHEHQGVQEFLAFGLVFTSYGAAMALGTHGFLAAFTSGLALRWVEGRPRDESEQTAMAHKVLGFKERVERLLEAVNVVLIGALTATIPWDSSLLWLAPLLFVIVRPLAVMLGLWGARISNLRRSYIAWFGIRGIGSVYYFSYAVGQGLPTLQAQSLAALVYPLLALSIIVHGLSVSPLMERYSEDDDPKAC